jgi:hypothetical protein
MMALPGPPEFHLLKIPLRLLYLNQFFFLGGGEEVVTTMHKYQGMQPLIRAFVCQKKKLPWESKLSHAQCYCISQKAWTLFWKMIFAPAFTSHIYGFVGNLVD